MAINVYPTEPIEVTPADTPALGAFSRIRTAEPYGIYDFKQIETEMPNQIETVTAGAGTTAYQYDRSSTYLTVGTASGDRALRQSVKYIPYVPGKSQQVFMTGIFGAGKANVDQYIGYGDDLNGLFFKLQGTTFGIVLRTSVSGTAADTFIAQSSWNVDPMDGTGPSGITLDITKSQIFIIDFQWLGVGRVRFALDIDGMIIPIHEILNANVLSSVYMKTPTLPIRYEIINTGVSASSTTLEQICASVASEGGYSIPGLEFTKGNGVTRRAVTTRAPIFAIRLKTAFPTGEPNRRTVRYLKFKASATTNSAYVELAHMHNPSGITATWTSISPDSAVEYSTDITAITGNPEHIVEDLTAVAGLGTTTGTATETSEFVNEHSFISQNFDSTNSQVFVLYATSFTGTSNVSGSITEIEFS